jgi:hypothetical protein
MPNHCIQLTAEQRAFNVFSVSFCEVIYNQRHQAAATDAGRSLSTDLNLPLDNVHIFVYFIIMKTISFYTTVSGKCPVKDHLDSLSDNQAIKIAWVLKLIRELDQVPSRYFKKLINTEDIWEVRVNVGKKRKKEYLSRRQIDGRS